MRIIPFISLVILLAVYCKPVQGQNTVDDNNSQNQVDALDEALGLVNLTRGDLGWRPKGYWTGFPADIPYKLRQFDALMAEPLANITYLRTMANSARAYLDPVMLDADPPRESSGALYQAVHRLGIERKFGGFRSYSCNLTAVATELDAAILKIYERADRPTKFITFGTVSPYPVIEEGLAEQMFVVPEEVRPIVGKLIMNILDAHHWANLAMRKVPLADRMAVARRLNIGEEEVDALDYCPEFDDVARAWDEASMWYAGLKCVEALDQARKELMFVDMEEIGAFAFDWRTPLGWVRVRGTGQDNIDCSEDTLLVVDLGGDDHYSGHIAAASGMQLIGLLLDMGGDDNYKGDEVVQGAGVCGIGVLLDVSGDDIYEANQYAQGVGQFGLGACIDLSGDDEYRAKFSAQGCGYFGVGIQMDVAGNDSYTLYSEGQGFGGVNGVGVLADRLGNDKYEAVRDGAVTGRASYHSEQKISVSNAQGCAMGRRGDGADGHSWAGGMGVLIDIEGSDTYSSGNWSMGTGYWFGMGYLYDGNGDDEYSGVVWSQATGAHFCIGVLLDEGGNDKHIAVETSTNSLAFGHDFTVALLVNLGGNDIYEMDKSGLGYSINRSVAMLIDIGGDDQYRESVSSRPGMAIYDESRFGNWDSYSTYFADSSSLGLFLDVGGNDLYDQIVVSPDRHLIHKLVEPMPLPLRSDNEDYANLIKGTILECVNNSVWLDPETSLNNEVRNFSVGVDRESGTVDFRPIPEKAPSSK